MEGGSTHRENFLKKHNLPDKGYSLKELAKVSGENMATLQDVYNRGIGAYKTNPTSVRMKGSFKKNVNAPMNKKLSKEQWAMARVYSFLDGSKKHDGDLRGGDYDLRGQLEGAGIWDVVREYVALPFQPQKIINEVINPDSIARRRINDVVRGIRKDYPPSSRAVIQRYADWTITELRLRRDPVESAINTAFNLITFGAWNKAKLETNMDKLFHLGVEATVEKNGATARVLLEKNEVINVGMPKPVGANTEYLRLSAPNPPVSLLTFLQKAEALRPGGGFFKYDPFQNNCQDFIAGLLQANGVWQYHAQSFVKQNVQTLLDKLPSYTHAFAKGITDLGGIVNVALEGGKSAETLTRPNPPPRFLKQLQKAGLEPSSYLEEARRRAKKHHYPYKLLGFAQDGDSKLAIPDKDGRLVAFGKVGYGDHIIYSHQEANKKVPTGTADAKRNTFQKSHTKIRGDWASKPFSPNNLALRILW